MNEVSQERAIRKLEACVKWCDQHGHSGVGTELHQVVKLLGKDKSPRATARDVKVGSYDPCCALCRDQHGRSRAGLEDKDLCDAHAMAIARMVMTGQMD